MLPPELNTEPSTQQAIREYWLTGHMFWCLWRAGFAAALLNRSSFLSWKFLDGNLGGASMKILLAASNNINGGKKYGSEWFQGWPSNLVTPSRTWALCILLLCHPQWVGTLSHLARWLLQLQASHLQTTASEDIKRGGGFSYTLTLTNLMRGEKLSWKPIRSHWPKTGYVTARKAGKPNISACIMGCGSDGKEEREQIAKA